MAAIEHAVIMAAGRGSRMMPLTDVIPKPMAPYGDSTLIGSGIAKVRQHIQKIHITVGYKGAMLAQHLMEIGVSTIVNTEGHSNAWWLHHSVLRHLAQPAFVLTCDNVTDIDFASLAKDYFAQGEPACMLVPVAPVAGLEGDYIFHENGTVVALDRQRPSDIYCSGIQVLNPAKVVALAPQEGDFMAVWSQLIAQRSLKISNIRPTKWFSVDTVADLNSVRAKAAQ